MNTYSNQPRDLHLEPKELQRETALYLFGQAKLTGEAVDEIAKRMGPLIEHLGSLKVVREKYAERLNYEPSRTQGDRVDRLKGIADTVRTAITRNSVVEGSAVHEMRQWQGLDGDRSKGLLLIGDAGSGKTLHAAMLLLGNILDIEPEGYFIGESVLVMHLSSGTKSDRRDALRPLESTPLLVVDYMGQRKQFSGWESSLMEFLRVRWESGRKCVMTFRGDLGAFKSTYGADGWATVERWCTVIQVRRSA